MPRNQAQCRLQSLDDRLQDVALAGHQRAQTVADGARLTVVAPQRHQPVFVQEHRSQVRLRVQIGHQHLQAMVGIHPRQVVDQRGLADAALVVEERDGLHGCRRGDCGHG